MSKTPFSPEQRAKAKRERQVFRIFAHAVWNEINPLCVCSPRDDKASDILCYLASGEQVVFELGEVLDDGLGRTIGDSPRFSDHLQEIVEVAPFKARFEEMFSNAYVYIMFREHVTSQQRRNAANLILEYLCSLSPEVTGEVIPRDQILSKAVMTMYVYRGDFKGPLFGTVGGGGVADPTLRMLKAKFEKEYSTSGPLELLLYYGLQPEPMRSIWEPGVSRCVSEYFESCRLQKSSRFRRVWIFSCASKQILYMHPAF